MILDLSLRKKYIHLYFSFSRATLIRPVLVDRGTMSQFSYSFLDFPSSFSSLAKIIDTVIIPLSCIPFVYTRISISICFLGGMTLVQTCTKSLVASQFIQGSVPVDGSRLILSHSSLS